MKLRKKRRIEEELRGEKLSAARYLCYDSCLWHGLLSGEEQELAEEHAHITYGGREVLSTVGTITLYSGYTKDK